MFLRDPKLFAQAYSSRPFLLQPFNMTDHAPMSLPISSIMLAFVYIFAQYSTNYPYDLAG
ncbi:uncharacterized protein M421DRAFT_420590, partial [Didymella exigua CBS 183.55]